MRDWMYEQEGCDNIIIIPNQPRVSEYDCPEVDSNGREYGEETGVENTHIGKAFDILKQALQEDEEYAWTFHCNLAVPMMDEGCSHKKANKAAARIMYNLFRVDTSQSKYFKDLGFNTKFVVPDDNQTTEPFLNS
jgi:hypothetical protein